MIKTLSKSGVNKGASIICQQTIVTLATDQRDKLKTQLTFTNLTKKTETEFFTQFIKALIKIL